MALRVSRGEKAKEILPSEGIVRGRRDPESVISVLSMVVNFSVSEDGAQKGVIMKNIFRKIGKRLENNYKKYYEKWGRHVDSDYMDW